LAQVKPQVPPPPQVAADAPLGTGQAVHDDPQELTLVLEAQVPLQSCVPPGHWPLQAALLSMQFPAQACCPEGQLTPQVPAWQVADPPVID
jgi:hypothetical protein